MGQILGPERLKSVVRVSNTQVRLEGSSADPVIASIGGQQFVIKSNLTCDISFNGFGGLDIGSPSSLSILHFYLVRQSGINGLIASLSDVTPLGYTIFNSKYVGSFNVNWNTILGGLLHNYKRELQPIEFRVETDTPQTRYNTAPANGSIIAEYDDVITDTHLGYDISEGRWYVPISKNYSGSGIVGFSGSYADHGQIRTSFRVNNGNNATSVGIRNSSSTGAFNSISSFSAVPISIFIDFRVVLDQWTSVSAVGASDQNNWGVTG